MTKIAHNTSIPTHSPTNSISTISLEDSIAYCFIAPLSDKEDMFNLVHFCTMAVHKKMVRSIAVDISQSEGFSKEARKVWVTLLKDPQVYRIAFYGGDIYTETTVSFIVGATDTDNCKVFPSRSSALAWLTG